MSILPPDFDARLEAAVARFWSQRSDGPSGGQEGSRGRVIGGGNMNGFSELVSHVAVHCGLPSEAVLLRKRRLVLPGYFRATKNWDVLVVHDGRLVAAFEFKSQVGSFGNNFNNRAEEAVGSATDLWVAVHQGAYVPKEPPGSVGSFREEPALNPALRSVSRPPFVAWLMLLEDCHESLAPVCVDEPHFPVFPEFRRASYADRYRILCEKLVERRLYDAAAIVLSGRPALACDQAAHRGLSESTLAKGLFAAFAGRVLGELSI